MFSRLFQVGLRWDKKNDHSDYYVAYLNFKFKLVVEDDGRGGEGVVGNSS